MRKQQTPLTPVEATFMTEYEHQYDLMYAVKFWLETLSLGFAALLGLVCWLLFPDLINADFTSKILFAVGFIVVAFTPLIVGAKIINRLVEQRTAEKLFSLIDYEDESIDEWAEQYVTFYQAMNGTLPSCEEMHQEYARYIVPIKYAETHKRK